MAVVCEPTGDEVYVAHRGTTWMDVEIIGRSAHSGRPWLGVNAISKASRIVQAIETDLAPRLSTRTHPMLPPPSINLGGIEGGTKYNLVADRCVLRLDRRMLPGETLAECIEEIRSICASVQGSDPEAFTWDVREVMCVEPAEVPRDSRIVRECRRAFAEVTHKEAGIGATAGFEDAHFFVKAGIEVAMFGPYRTDPPGDNGP
jgi:acetylornithine deacetylase/succinyl-diaminopimelate desuccinylase